MDKKFRVHGYSEDSVFSCCTLDEAWLGWGNDRGILDALEIGGTVVDIYDDTWERIA